MLVYNCRQCFCLYLWSLLVLLYSFDVRVNVSVSLFCSCCWCFCACLESVLVPLSCSRLLFVPYSCDLAVVFDLFVCLCLLLVPLSILWSLLVLSWLRVVNICAISDCRLYSWLISSSACLSLANIEALTSPCCLFTAKFVDIRYSHWLTRFAVSRKVAVVVEYRLARPFVHFFQVLVIVSAASSLQLIAPCLPIGSPQLLVLVAYDAAHFQLIVVFLLKNVTINHYI